MFGSDKVENFLEEYKSIYDKYINFIESEENIEENFMNLTQIIVDAKIKDCQHKLRLFLRMVISIADNHQHCQQFYAKIDQTLEYFKDDIKKYFLNSEIFSIFKSNKRILLFLIEEKILTVDEYFAKQIIKYGYIKNDYPQYFAPEIKPFINEEWFPKYNSNSKYYENKWVEDVKKELPDNFLELRKIGENDSYISKLIREDSVEDFIIYVNKNCISRNATINKSVYETNSFLLKNQFHLSRLIEYAAFFGSIQIFTFLKNENVDLTSSLWLNAIHGKNADIIHILEENHVKLPSTKKQKYRKCIIESIKCNHNEFANYFLNNFIQDKDEYSNDVIIKSLKYYDFSFLQNENINESSFCYLCYFDYYSLVYILLNGRNIDVNTKIIQNHIF